MISSPKFNTKIGCLRWAVSDVALFRVCKYQHRKPLGCQFTRKLTRLAAGAEEFLLTRRYVGKKLHEIEKWEPPELRHVMITQDYGRNSRAVAKVFVKEYAPRQGDILDYNWWENGVEKVLHMPPFALMDVASIARNMWEYIDTFGRDYIEDRIDESNKILWKTFDIAFRTAEAGSVRPSRVRITLFYIQG
jgi:hypothetical protein